MSDFTLAAQLQQDCIEVADWPLCKVLLLNDSQYPWFILVPKRANLTEIIDLTDEEQLIYMRESAQLSRLLIAIFKPDKLNIAALGNMVPQLHIHHIARFVNDPAWPAPVWGKLPAIAYTAEQIAQLKPHFQA